MNTILCLTNFEIVKWLLDKKIETIYKKFQLKLKLNQEVVDYSQRLHIIVLLNNKMNYESPYLIVSICIFIVSRLKGCRKTLEEISKVSHIPQDEILKGYDMVLSQIMTRIK